MEWGKTVTFDCDFCVDGAEEKERRESRQQGPRKASWEVCVTVAGVALSLALVLAVLLGRAVHRMRRHCPKRYQHGDWFRNQGD